MKRTHVIFSTLVMCLALVAAAPVDAQEERCCFNNFRFAGGCMVIPQGSTTCADILGALNNFNSVGNTYCDGTTVRGGWSMSDCGNPAQINQSPVVPQTAQPSQPIRPKQNTGRATSPQTAPAAQDANLLQVSAPLKVQFDGSVDSDSNAAGHMVTGTLQEDLMSGDTVVAPAGSQVHARLVPTSYWTDGGGDAFEIQATGIEVDGKMIPVSATAVGATGEIDTMGRDINVPKGSMVSFEAQSPDQQKADKMAIQGGSLTWAKAFDSMDIDGVTSVYTHDAVLLPPNEPAVFGIDAIRATTMEMMNAGLTVELEGLELNIQGALGYMAGRYRMRNADGDLVDRGKYIEIWSKVDGEWKIHRDIWNSSLPSSEDHED